MQSFEFLRNLSLSGVLYGRTNRDEDMDTKELVERCKRGERQAMGLLYATYVNKLEQVSRKYLNNETDVQDVVHDSFVVIFTSMDMLRDARKLESWMCTIVRNLSLQQARLPILEDVATVELADDGDAEFFDYDRLMAMVEQLPDGYKNVLKLSTLQGLSHKEIGKILGIAPHSSSSQLARAKEMMRRNWKLCGVVFVALVAMLLPFLFTKENSQEKLVAEKPVTPEKEEITADTTVQKFFVPIAPILPNNLVAQQTDTINQKDSAQTYIAEATEKDTLDIQPIDSTKEERRIVPNIMPNIQPSNRMIADETRKKKENGWNLAVAFAGGNDNSLLASAKFPGAGGGIGSDIEPDTLVNTSTRHFMPLTFSLSLSKSLSPRWNVETGLRYTLLRSETTTTTSVSDNSIAPTIETTEQKIHYIGIPLKLTYSLWRTPSFSLYTSGGAAADIPVSTPNPILWSINFGAGIQYQITPNVSLYTEPSLNYYLNPNSGTPTLRTDRPSVFTIPVGLRLSW